MINKKYLQLIRSYNRFDINNFIFNKIAERITDSLDLLNIEIKQALEIGINENLTFDYLKSRFIKSKIDRADISLSKRKIGKNFSFYKIDVDNLNLKKNYYDIIFSNFFLHLTNNFEKNLRNIFEGLCSNGFFITAIPNKESMFQLLNSMYETDIFFYNGAFQRFNPTIEIDNIFAIMKNLDFNSPSIHTDTITIDYMFFDKLLEDIKKMNLSYSYLDKKDKFENKNYFKKLEKIFKKNYPGNNFILEIKINIVSAWKK